jgi:hypothetical protein
VFVGDRDREAGEPYGGRGEGRTADAREGVVAGEGSAAAERGEDRGEGRGVSFSSTTAVRRRHVPFFAVTNAV